MKHALFLGLIAASFTASAETSYNTYETLNLSLGYTRESFDYSVNSVPFTDKGHGIALDARYFDSGEILGPAHPFYGLSFRYRDGEQFPSGASFTAGLEIGTYLTFWNLMRASMTRYEFMPEWLDFGTGASLTGAYHHFSETHPVYEPFATVIGSAFVLVRVFNVLFTYSYGLETRLGALTKEWEADVKFDPESFVHHSTFQLGWLF